MEVMPSVYVAVIDGWVLVLSDCPAQGREWYMTLKGDYPTAMMQRRVKASIYAMLDWPNLTDSQLN